MHPFTRSGNPYDQGNHASAHYGVRQVPGHLDRSDAGTGGACPEQAHAPPGHSGRRRPGGLGPDHQPLRAVRNGQHPRHRRYRRTLRAGHPDAGRRADGEHPLLGAGEWWHRVVGRGRERRGSLAAGAGHRPRHRGGGIHSHQRRVSHRHARCRRRPVDALACGVLQSGEQHQQGQPVARGQHLGYRHRGGDSWER